MAEAWTDACKAALGPLCEAVDLRPEDRPELIPEGSAVWLGRYAIVVLWPTEAGKLTGDATLAEAWFADFLDAEEVRRNARVVDGYLLLALHEKTDEGQASEVRSVELSTRICRKHVVWPEADGQWLRFDGVTVLGLPPGVTSTSGEPEWPALAADARPLWTEIQKGAAKAAQAEARRV